VANLVHSGPWTVPQMDGAHAANAAAIEAGIRQRTFMVPANVEGLARVLVNRDIDRDELYRFMGEARERKRLEDADPTPKRSSKKLAQRQPAKEVQEKLADYLAKEDD
jgi:hypothetical protein